MMRTRLWLPLLVLVFGAGPLALALAWSVPADWTDRLSPELPNRVGVPLEMDLLPAVGPSRTAGMPVTVGDVRWLADADEVRLLMATYNTPAQLTTARLNALDGSCEFVAAPDARLINNGELVLRKTRCLVQPGPQPFMLWVRVGEEGRVAAWTFPTTLDTRNEPFIISAPDQSAHFAVRGAAHFPGIDQGRRRVDLVAFVWQRDAATIWFWLGLLAGLAVTGAFVLASVSGTGARGAAGTAAGLAMLATSIAVTWAVITPPLQGADEPDHLLSFAEVTGATQVAPQLEWLARRTHFERLRFQGNEHLRPVDLTHAHDPAWTGDVHAERMDQRSPVAVWVWRAAGALGVRTLALPDLLLAIRVLNALIFAGVVAVAMIGVWWAAGGRIGVWSCAGLALLPSLPYFATMVSDWALLVSWAVLFAVSLRVLMHDGMRGSWAGLGLGLAAALMIATSISALALAPLLLIVLAGRLLMGPALGPEPVSPWRAPIIFWSGLGIGGVVAYALTETLLRTGYARYDASAGTSAALLATVNEGMAQLTAHPWLIVMPPIVFALADRACMGLRRSTVLQVLGARVVVLVGVAVAAGVTITAVGSLFYQWPQVPTLEAHTFADVWDYIMVVVAAAATAARVLGHDHLTFVSMWSGFGWIDTILPTYALAALSALAAMALVTSIWSWRRRGAHRELGWFVIGLAGALASLIAYAAAGYLMHRNLHGRYLIGLSVPLLVLLTAGAGRVIATASPRARLAAATVLVLIHGGSLVWVLLRYF